MATIYSFKGFIQKRYLELIKGEIFRLVEFPLCRFNIHSNSLENISKVSVVEIELRSTNPYDSLSDNLIFTIDVKVKLELLGISNGKDSKDLISKWLSIACELKLNGGIKDFRIRNISEYRKPSQKDRLTDHLIPYIYEKDFDKHAENILKMYYPEALLSPTRIDVRLFAKWLGLNIVEVCLSSDHSILGQMIFHDCQVEVYDLDNGCIKLMDVERGTIIVDPNIRLSRTANSWNNTVIHECIHWLKHRKRFELAKMYDGTAGRMSCMVSIDSANKRKYTDIDRMEWQARSIAPRILMPYNQFHQKAMEIIQQHNPNEQLAITPDIIYELSKFFGVSAQSAKIRLIEIGYKNAIGVLEYVDDHYVKDYAFDDDFIKKNQTFSISIKDSLSQYISNPDFRKILHTGHFLYIDSHYCLKDPKYVGHDSDGKLFMTQYAYDHMDECCLVFVRITHPTKSYDCQRHHAPWTLFNSETSTPATEHIYDGIYFNIEESSLLLCDEAEDVAMIMSKLPGSFSEALTMLMEWRNRMSKEELSAKSLVSLKMIQKMRNGKERERNIRTVVALCIGLKLPPIISLLLLAKAGLQFKINKEECLIALLLCCFYKEDIKAVNKIIVGAGYLPLSGRRLCR